ncbi:MAG TPA: MoxR family ATPase [Myxococcota bacterium]|nr:MoxR family ATPase [Myxococcota bacterium]HRY94784.1 MoxR family ATPase [Myxococcota bacterium]
MRDGFDRFAGTRSYITSPELRHAVNVAVALGRPLLVKGEPGTGKTLLAHAVAEDLGLELITWNVKSTSKAADGLYVYDTVRRLQDSRFGDKDVSDIRQYIRLGPLGRALVAERLVVLLIDEIDKADLEFPNDLLHELDAMEFEVLETSERHRARQRPVVVITSNAEKELPDPFLRRCVFHFIRFPDEAQMAEIVGVHHPELPKKMLKQCLERFYWLREVPGLRKRPSTSELIDWIGALVAAGLSPGEVAGELPFLGTLVKKPEDVEAVAQASGRARGGGYR